jgi:glucose/arabinose dehydrogenase
MRRIITHYSVELICICMIVTGVMLITNTGCKRKDSPQGITTTPGLRLIADNIASPIGMGEIPDATGRLFIIDQTGKIWIVKDGKKLDEPFLDISARMVSLNPSYDERGLLGVAFHPNNYLNGKFYVFYTAPPRIGGPEPGSSWNNLTRVSEFYASPGSNRADEASEKIILEEDHPQGNHNGGTIAFGHDGYLYISIGDGGGANDNQAGHVSDWYTVNTGGNAQNIYANLMGKILRIDVNAVPYAIPGDNPFTTVAGAKGEIYAFGFRNPYRFSFDMAGSHKLYAGDAGQVLYEEINMVEKGGNYGWNVKEGISCFNTDDNKSPRASCPSQDDRGLSLTGPIIELKNAANPAGGIATTIIGGHVYRGSTFDELRGKYIFGVFSTSSMAADAKVYTSSPGASGYWSYEELKLKDYPNSLGMYLKGFGQDSRGEIYITTSMQLGVSGNTGKVYKIVAAQ